MERQRNPDVPIDARPFRCIPVHRKFTITEVDPESGAKDTVSINRLTEQHLRLKWRDPHGAKSVVDINLEASTARLDGLFEGNHDWARAGVTAVLAHCLLYLRHERVMA